MAHSSTSRSGQPAGDLTDRVLGGRYRLGRHIASGGMAQVWEGTDQVLARKVAVKILHPHLASDEAFVRRFRGEAVAAARLAHPSIVSVYDTLSEDGIEAIVMELVTGTTLRSDLDQHGPLKLSAVLAIGTQVADALGAAHVSGLVHRDVKPANILLSADGRVLVADFGIAKAVEAADLTSEGSMVGTAKYLAPEQVEGGPLDGRTDLYALGVVLYEALTGRPPFQGDSDMATALARLHRNPIPPRQYRPDIPPAVEAVVGRALARRPEDRFANAAAMRAALVSVGADPAQAPAAAQAAVAAATGEHTAAARRIDRLHAAEPVYHEPAKRRRSALRVLLVLAAIGAVLAVALNATRAGPEGSPLTIRSISTFDPVVGDGEMDDLLVNINDEDPTTYWRTERYSRPEAFTDKGGVGLVVGTDSSAELRQLEVSTAEGGWSASLFVAEGDPPSALAGWGEPVAQIEEAKAGGNLVDLHGRRGDTVLIWFTSLASDQTVQIGDLEVRGT